jgi:dihydrofolate reductase
MVVRPQRSGVTGEAFNAHGVRLEAPAVGCRYRWFLFDVEVKEISMGKVFADHSISLDGFSTGPNVRVDNGMGDGGEALHEWMFQDGGKTGHHGEVLEDLFGSTGAVVVGRRMFDLGEKPWGDNPPFHRPVFVVTHRPKAMVTKQGGTTYTFVTDGLEAAVAQARAIAGDRDVVVLGGASVIQQCLRAGLLSELRLHVAHILLGGGTILFGGVDPTKLALERTRLIDAEGVSHLTFRVEERR